MDDIDINHAATDAFGVILQAVMTAHGGQTRQAAIDVATVGAVVTHMMKVWAEDFDASDVPAQEHAVAFAVATREKNRTKRRQGHGN